MCKICIAVGHNMMDPCLDIATQGFEILCHIFSVLNKNLTQYNGHPVGDQGDSVTSPLQAETDWLKQNLYLNQTRNHSSCYFSRSNICKRDQILCKYVKMINSMNMMEVSIDLATFYLPCLPLFCSL